MCNYFSCLVTRDKKVLWSEKTNSHEDLIEKFGLKDNKLEDRDFVRVEVTPQDKPNRNVEEWAFKIDEVGTLPDWFNLNQEEIKEKVLVEALVSAKQQLVLGNEEKIVKSGFARAWGSSTVEAWDSSTVEAMDSSTVEAMDSSTVKAWGSSAVKARGSSAVVIYSCKKIVLKAGSQAVAIDRRKEQVKTYTAKKDEDVIIK